MFPEGTRIVLKVLPLIRLLRLVTGWGLVEAKVAVEHFLAAKEITEIQTQAQYDSFENYMRKLKEGTVFLEDNAAGKLTVYKRVEVSKEDLSY